MSRDSIFTVALAVGSGVNVNTYKRAQKRRFFQENVRRFVKKSALLGSLIGVKCPRLPRRKATIECVYTQLSNEATVSWEV